MICLEKNTFSEEIKNILFSSLNLTPNVAQELEGFTCRVFKVNQKDKPCLLLFIASCSAFKKGSMKSSLVSYTTQKYSLFKNES